MLRWIASVSVLLRFMDRTMPSPLLLALMMVWKRICWLFSEFCIAVPVVLPGMAVTVAPVAPELLVVVVDGPDASVLPGPFCTTLRVASFWLI